MKLEHLSIVNYKNIREADLDFSSGVNCLVGKNGMGKTNLLDAIYYLSFCKSFNGVTDSQVMTHGEEFFMLNGQYELNGEAEDIRCGYKLHSRKSFKRAGKEYQRLSDHIGLLPIVLLTPSDSVLLQGGSEERRKFMDMVISQFNKPYLNALIRYNQALLQRNSLLKQEPPCTDPLLYQTCEEQMDFYGRMIYAARRQFVDDFTPVFQEQFHIFPAQPLQVFPLLPCRISEHLQAFFQFRILKQFLPHPVALFFSKVSGLPVHFQHPAFDH